MRMSKMKKKIEKINDLTEEDSIYVIMILIFEIYLCKFISVFDLLIILGFEKSLCYFLNIK